MAGIDATEEMGLALSVVVMVRGVCVLYKDPSIAGCTGIALAMALTTHALGHIWQTYPGELRRLLGLSE